MAVDPSAPVVVGVGAVIEHATDPLAALDAFELMCAATEHARDDTGSDRVLEKIDLVLVPRGTWADRDPGRAVAARFGADARSVIADIGILQQTLLTAAATAVASGDADVVLVCGSEAKERTVLAAKAGVELLETGIPRAAIPTRCSRPRAG